MKARKARLHWNGQGHILGMDEETDVKQTGQDDEDESGNYKEIGETVMKEEDTFLREKAGNRSDRKRSLGSVDLGQT